MKKYTKPIIFGLIVVVILVLNEIFGWSEYLGNIENLSFLDDMVKENIVEASLIYCVITIIGSVVLALPGVTFAIFAGLLFGPWLGTLLCLVASTVGAIIAFVVGRFFLQETIRPMVMKNKWIKKVLFDEAGRSDIVVLMITRLVPLFPYNLQNFAYGITNIGFIPYSVYTFLFLIPGVALYTIGFAGFTAESNRWVYFAVAGIMFVLVLFLGWFVKKKFLGGGKDPEECSNVETNLE